MGWIERFIALATARSPMAPQAFHELVALHTISSVIGRNVFMSFGPGTIYPNIWGLMLGESGVTRKTTTKSFGEEMLLEVAKDLRLSDAVSPEGLISELAEKSSNGICHVWTVQDEFGRVISGIKHKEYMSDVKDMLMQLYDGKPISRRLAKMAYQVDPVYMTFLSATTESRLAQLLKPEDLEDGFFPRFLVRLGTSDGWKSRPDITPAMQQEATDLKEQLRALRLAYSNHITEVVLSPEAKRFYDAWCADLYSMVKRGEYPGAVSARLEDYFLKMTMLWELSEHMAFLGHRHAISYERAEFVGERMGPYVEDAAKVFEQLGSDRYVEMVYRIVENAGPEGIPYRLVVRRSKLSAKRISSVLDTLEAAGRIEYFESRLGSRGPKAIILRAVVSPVVSQPSASS